VGSIPQGVKKEGFRLKPLTQKKIGQKNYLSFLNFLNISIMVYELCFSIPNVGNIVVNFKISFGGIERLYPAGIPTACKNHFKNISERIHIVSIHGGYYELDWNALIKIDLKQAILSEVLEIKDRHEGNYLQVSMFNWIP
jgi:hypothetical protein